jgi:uncharacterized protein YndB with AHSA1/START domain
METQNKPKITVETTVNAPVEKAWEYWTTPEHVTSWNSPSDDWHTPSASNDLRVGGDFSYRMEARDGSFGFDFGGTYDEVDTHRSIAYTIGDGRKVKIDFLPEGNQTRIVQTFEAENQHPIEVQRGGWQAIMDNYKKHIEAT